ncbi:MAG: hypothetical protein JSR44_04695 [Spirochaetes bacterium]|nr:hypothetical protein [Spirochaetota bacterium]
MRLNISLLSFFLSASAILAQAAAPKSEMARVAVILYEDKTGTQNFGYMPESLQKAIIGSMKTKFEFIEVDAAKIEPIAAQVRTKNKGIIGAKEAAEICRLADIDILIYGNFIFNDAEKEIAILTEISLGSTDKYRTLPPKQNRVDASIFQAADYVAADIVQEIAKVALEQQQAKGKAELSNKKKTQLEKIEKSKTWADINWSFALSAGPLLPLVSNSQANIRTQPAVSLNSQYRLKDNWHVGLLLSVASFHSSSTNAPYNTSFDHGAAAATLGYFFDLSPRWRWTNLVGLGYYAGYIKTWVDCQTNNCGTSNPTPDVKVSNPLFLARTGLHFMIFSFLALGLEAEWRIYYDSKPLMGAGALLTITGMF